MFPTGEDLCCSSVFGVTPLRDVTLALTIPIRGTVGCDSEIDMDSS